MGRVCHGPSLYGPSLLWAEFVMGRVCYGPSCPVTLQRMVKTSVKFQKNRSKTVGGVAHTRYPLSIRFHCQNARKMTKFKLRKKCEKLI